MNTLLRPRRARFWVFINMDWVKLTLRQSHSLYYVMRQQPTEEGYHYESNMWTFEGKRVVHQWSDGGRDCDGSIERYGAQFCHLDDLHAEPADDDGTTSAYHHGQHIHRPSWANEDFRTVVRDEFAEAAGY